MYQIGSSSGSGSKESASNAGDPRTIPGLGRSPGEGNGYPLQYFCLENPTDRGAWGRKESDKTELRTFSLFHDQLCNLRNILL